MLQQQHQIGVERSFNPNCTVKAFGKKPGEATKKVYGRRDLRYWDATKAYPKEQPEPGTEKGSPRDDR